MTSVSFRISGAFNDASVLKLFQSASVAQNNQNGAFRAAAEIDATLRGPGAKAIESIIQIVMKANGDTSLTADTDGTVTGAYTGKGDDEVDIDAANAWAITSGEGDDKVNIKTSANGKLPSVMWVGTGGGNDELNIDAKGVVMAVSGEEGNDTVKVRTDDLAFGVYGGLGDDSVTVDAKYATLVDGGDGNDVVNVTAQSMFGISGGKGDDVLNLTNKGDEAAVIFYSLGDGKDVINSDGAVSINLFSADGTKKMDMSQATWKQEGDTVTIAFGDTGDALTINLTGDAASGNASVTYDDKTGNLIVGPGTSEKS